MNYSYLHGWMDPGFIRTEGIDKRDPLPPAPIQHVVQSDDETGKAVYYDTDTGFFTADKLSQPQTGITSRVFWVKYTITRASFAYATDIHSSDKSWVDRSLCIGMTPTHWNPKAEYVTKGVIYNQRSFATLSGARRLTRTDKTKSWDIEKWEEVPSYPEEQLVVHGVFALRPDVDQSMQFWMQAQGIGARGSDNLVRNSSLTIVEQDPYTDTNPVPVPGLGSSDGFVWPTPAMVKQILSTSLNDGDIERAIQRGSGLTLSSLANTDTPNELLHDISIYISAHYAYLREQQEVNTHNSVFSPFDSELFHNSSNLSSTEYGKKALCLDETGTLKAVTC